MTLSNFTVNLCNTDTLFAMASSVPVEIATQATEELLAACHRLIPQLSSSAKPMTNDELAEPNCWLIDSRSFSYSDCRACMD